MPPPCEDTRQVLDIWERRCLLPILALHLSWRTVCAIARQLTATEASERLRPHIEHLNSAVAASAALSAAASRLSSASADAAIRTAPAFTAPPAAGAGDLEAASGAATGEACWAAGGVAAAACCPADSVEWVSLRRMPSSARRQGCTPLCDSPSVLCCL